MLRLLKILLLFAGVFLVYDKFFLLIAKRSAEAEVDKRLEYLVKGEINADIVFIGSSRGARAIIADQVEKETGLSAYNLCYPGSNVEFHEFLIRTMIEFNNTPKMVFLVVDDDTEFEYDNAIIFRKDRLYPLVKYSYIWKELAERVNRDKFFSRFLIINRLSKYNFDLSGKKFTPLDTIMERGSMPISWQSNINDRYLKADEGSYTREDEVKEYVDAYQEIIKTCKLHNTPLVVVFPPLLREHSASFEKRIKELGDANTHYFVYDMDNPRYRNKDYFHDGGHLIREGAEIYSNEVVEYIDSFYLTN